MGFLYQFLRRTLEEDRIAIFIIPAGPPDTSEFIHQISSVLHPVLCLPAIEAIQLTVIVPRVTEGIGAFHLTLLHPLIELGEARGNIRLLLCTDRCEDYQQHPQPAHPANDSSHNRDITLLSNILLHSWTK